MSVTRGNKPFSSGSGWSTTLFNFFPGLGRWRSRHFDRRVSPTDDQDPLRAELLSADQMEDFGKTLASLHSLSRVRTRDRLLSRLDDNEQVLLNTCTLLTEAIKARSFPWR